MIGMWGFNEEYDGVSRKHMMGFQGGIWWGFKEEYDGVSMKNMMGFQGKIG